jgi:hypothetical protein
VKSVAYVVAMLDSREYRGHDRAAFSPVALAIRQRGPMTQPPSIRQTKDKIAQEKVVASHAVTFTSHVSELHRGSLELLVYFNAVQSRVADSIIDAVERFGPLEIAADGERLRIRVSGLPEAQSLFAVEAATGRPLGVAVYARPDFQHMIVVHLGIAAEFASGGKRAHEQLLLRLLRELRRSSRRIKGVQSFELFYLAGRGRNALRQRDARFAATQ